MPDVRPTPPRPPCPRRSPRAGSARALALLSCCGAGPVPPWAVGQPIEPALADVAPVARRVGSAQTPVPGLAGASLSSPTPGWPRRERWSVALGLWQRPAWSAPAWRPLDDRAATDPRPALGLGGVAGPRPELSWQTPLTEADASNPLLGRRQLRVGLSFSAHDPYADLRRGALVKLELSGQTALALRPRGGRMGLTLTSRW